MHIKNYSIIFISLFMLIIFPTQIVFGKDSNVKETEYQITFMDALKTQLQEASPQTDKYAFDPAYIHSDYIVIQGSANVKHNETNLYEHPNQLAYTDESIDTDFQLYITKEVKDEITKEKNSWVETKIQDDTYYLPKEDVTNMEGITTDQVNVRSKPMVHAHIFGQIASYSPVQIISEKNNWYSIQYKDWRLPTAIELAKEMNPDNTHKLQHLRLDKLANANAKDLNKLLHDKGVLKKKGKAFIKGAKDAKINEAYLIAHAIHETGEGTSDLAKGIKVGKNKSGETVVVTDENKKSLTKIKKVYNMYGIDAVDNNAVEQGAIRAYDEGWDSVSKAIKGGAKWVAKEFIHNEYKQNTLYKMRWNPEIEKEKVPKQYATDIAWARKQIQSIKHVYRYIDKPTYHYDIPIYK